MNPCHRCVKTLFFNGSVPLFLLSALVMFVPSPLHSASFEELVASIWQHPAVLGLKEQSAGDRHQGEGATGFADPVITLGVNNLPVEDPEFDRYLPTSKSIGITQALPNFRQQSATAERLRRRGSKKELLAAWRHAEMVAEMVGILADYEKVESVITALKAQHQHYGELESWLQGRLESGAADYGRFAELDVSRTEIDRKLNELEGEKAVLKSRLHALTGIDGEPVVVPDQEAKVWDGRSDAMHLLKIANAGISVAEQGVAEKEAAYDPRFSFGATYQIRESGATFDGEDWVTAKVGVTVPLWQHFRQDPDLRAASARKSAAEMAYQDQLRTLRRTLDVLDVKRKTSERALELLQEKSDNLKKVEEAARRRYAAGRVQWEAVLRPVIRRLAIDVELAGERARRVKLIARINSHFITTE
ncbi:MAG: TolC family protein [Magnetococcales bacterium]|nr:TolC family protein [Magnetococcales bacterium]